MAFDPDRAKLEDECLLLYALADVLITKKRNRSAFKQFQYLSEHLDFRAEVLLAEHLLSIAVKLRYIDDRSKFLDTFDRNQLHVEDKTEPKEILRGVRWALNKLIHQTELSLRTDKHSSIVLGGGSTKPDELHIPPGLHEDEVVLVEIKGVGQNGKPWWYELSLTQLVNEVMRVLYKGRSN